MKVICLNIWGGRAGKEQLLAFFEKNRDSTDVFCLQEVWRKEYDMLEGALAGGTPINNSGIMTRALHEIGELLPQHVPYFHPSFHENYGLCTFVRNTFQVEDAGDVFVHHERGYVVPEGEDLGGHARNMQYVLIKTDTGPRLILNFHGLWNGKGKGDCAERLEQSARIVEFICSREEPMVFCGDFNLIPDTESLAKIEQSGLRNLITEFHIPSTRTSLYTKPEQYADYVFVSPEIEVNTFEVLPDVVSDHAPLYLDFS